jgi:predicted DNA-binding transcriptional regulator AlpA
MEQGGGWITRMIAVPTLDAIAADPRCAARLPREVIAGLLLKVAAVESALATALLDHEDNRATDVPAPVDGDRLLIIGEAAAKLGMTEGYLYRRKDLPFRINVAPGQVRFSLKGIEKFIRAKSAKRSE